MTPSLTTQFHRAVFALPLLAIGLAAAAGAGSLPAAPGAVADPATIAAAPVPGGAATTLPEGDFLALAGSAELDCAAPRVAGTRGLARMPGDISALAGRLRCAQ